MKHLYSTLFLGLCLGMVSCYDLDRTPLSQASSENWYKDGDEVEKAMNDFYRIEFWPLDNEDKTDDFMYRETPSEIVKGTFNGQSRDVETLWSNQYKSIARANTILAKLEIMELPEEQKKRYEAECRFQRATCYARLVTYFGDVVYLTKPVDIDEAYTLPRTPKSEIIPHIYEDYDYAITELPVKYEGSSIQRATKGAALALKARFALYMGDYETVAQATFECMGLGVYELHPDYADLFLSKTKNSKESVFVLPRSIEYDVTYNGDTFTNGNDPVKNTVSRNSGMWGAYTPSWELLASYECTDGLPIDESSLFDPHNPFKNRDPRCTATIVEFNTPHLGFEYDPHPDAVEVMNYNTGKMVKNNDARVNAQFASYNGLLWKKGVDETWLENGFDTDPDKIIIRYADVLLMYAEAKIELNQIDQSVLDAINQVRARAYGVEYTDVANYPEITTTNQLELRKVIRRERRVEFAKEGLRYMDLIRWRIAGKALSRPNYGMLYPVDLLKEKVVSQGLWFWPSVPQIDDDCIPDFSAMENAGLIAPFSQRQWNDRQYLWPIPTKEILINKNLEPQNPGY